MTYRWENYSVGDLLLDPLNPRLPEALRGKPQSELLVHIANNHQALDVGESIARHGFFPSEPLIAVEETGGVVVVEGNRRLTALKLLLFEECRTRELDDKAEWDALAILAAAGGLPSDLRVVVASSRVDTAPVVGFRHISGILQWDPWAKARFIVDLVDQQQMTFKDVAATVGEKANSVKAQYRNCKILRSGEESFGIPTKRARDAFGIFTTALHNVNIRNHIGAPAPSAVVANQTPLTQEAAEPLRELLSWMFGEQDGVEAVMAESRDISPLNEVLGDAEATRVLREQRDLSEARDAAGGPLKRLSRRLQSALSSLRAARSDHLACRDDPDIRDLVDQCRRAIDDLN